MPEHLAPEIAATRRSLASSARPLTAAECVVRLDQTMVAATEHVERAMIQFALAQADRNVERAAHMLGVSRKGLYLKRQRLEID
jgi:DNA-binding NtrC family response regulator